MGGGFNSERLNRVVALCDRYVNDGKFPCAQVQIAHKGEIVLRHTVGKSDKETDRELSENAIFRIYSMTKPLTSIALMQLYEQGHFILEDKIEAMKKAGIVVSESPATLGEAVQEAIQKNS